MAPPGECYYNTLLMLRLFFIIKCGIAHFIYARHLTVHIIELNWSTQTDNVLQEYVFCSGLQPLRLFEHVALSTQVLHASYGQQLTELGYLNSMSVNINVTCSKSLLFEEFSAITV